MSISKSGIIATSIKNEQTYQEEKRQDWMLTKKVLRTFLEELFPEGTSIYCGSGSITIRVPWGINNLQQARKAMGSGWKFSSNYTSADGTLTKSYHKYDDGTDTLEYDMNSYVRRSYVGLSLIMDAGKLDPDTCKRIEVGEKTYTQKIYQIICEDGVKEMLGKAEIMDDPSGAVELAS